MNDSLNLNGLVIQCDAGIATITLNQPEKRNVISDDPILSELTKVFELLDTDESISVVILTGSGSAFSAGGNIEKMHNREGMFSGSTDSIENEYIFGIQKLIAGIFCSRKVTIAAINGHAIGAGLDLALACDLRLASRDAKLGATFLNLGLIPGDGGSWLLPRSVGWQKASELIFTGRIISADEALEMGMLLSIHDSNELLGEASSLANLIASKPKLALTYAKELLRLNSFELKANMSKAALMQAVLHASDEHRQLLSKFFEERKLK